MNVILDTNILFTNWHLKGPSITVLETVIGFGKCKLIVPEIILLETKNKYREEIQQCLSNLGKIKRMLPPHMDNITIPDLQTVANEYDASLDKRLRDLNAAVISHSDIGHGEIVARALAGRKPFCKSGKGYRDTLLWEIVLRKIATQKDITILVSNNPKDFADDAKQNLHPELVADLTTANLNKDSVVLCSNLTTLVDKYLTPQLKKVTSDPVESLIRTGRFDLFSISEWFCDNKDHFIESGADWLPSLLDHYPEYEDPRVIYIEDPEDVAVDNVYELDDKTLYIEAVAHSDVIVDVFIYKADYGWLSDRTVLTVQDHDWNEHYMWAQMTLFLPIRFSLTFDPSSKVVEDFEVQGSDEIFGWCQHCGAAVLSDSAESCYRCKQDFF